MRVLQLHWTFPPTTGGVESHLADLSVTLANRGCEVIVVTGEDHPEERAGVRIVSTPLLDLAHIKSGRWDTASHTAALLGELEPLIDGFRPDVVHGHNLHHFAPGPAFAIDSLSRRYGFPIHHTFHETWPDILHDEPIYRGWAANYAVSEHVRRECETRIGFSPELRPLGIDVHRFSTSRTVFTDSTTPVILHPARLLPWKGVHTSIAMLANLRARGVEARLLVTDTARIADWDGELSAYRRDVLELVDRLRLSDVFALQPTAYTDMPRLYAEADIVVYPTIAAEPYGLVPLEAMSCQRPIVASRCGGIPETVVDGSTGWLVAPNNPDDLADRVAGLILDPEGARVMGRAGRKHVLANFGLDAYVDAMLTSYRAARNAERAGPPRLE